MDEHQELLHRAQTAFGEGRVAEVQRLLAALPETGAPWDAYFLAGVAARLMGDYQAALKFLAQTVRCVPHPELAANPWAETARVYGALDDVDRSRAALDRALQINPNLAGAWVDRAALELEQENYPLVEECLARATVLENESARFHEVQALLDIRHGRYREAREHYRKAREIDPVSPEALRGSASLYAMQGELEEARSDLEELFEINPQFPACRQYAQLCHFKVGDQRLDEWLKRLDSDEDEGEALTVEQEVDLLFACAKALDDLGEYSRAFACLERGNALRRSTMDYSVEAVLEGHDSAWDRLAGEILAAARQCGENSDLMTRRMVFIVGMPRSGSTLLEQMLAGHSRMQTIGETGLMARLMDMLMQLDPEKEGGDTSAALVRWFSDLRERYIKEVTRLASSGFQDCIIDKSLENFWYAGIIKALFPESLVVHAKRDPMDTCFGCYRQLFAGTIQYSYTQDELARYYRGYRKRMAEWADVFPECMTDIYYEHLIAQPEHELTKLFNQLGLDFEQSCLDFAASNRFVSTLSQIQVREPLNRSGVGRWKHYAQELEPLRVAIDDLSMRYGEEAEQQEKERNS